MPLIPERLPSRLTKCVSDSRGRGTYGPFVFREAATTVAPIPTVFVPPIENLANYSFFLERPILSWSREDVAPPFQDRATTNLSSIAS